MSQMFIETGHPGLFRHVLNGPTMGTRYSAVFFHRQPVLPGGLGEALFEAVDVVDRQMSAFKPMSDLMRVNAAPVGQWVSVPPELMEVLALGLQIGRQSGGLFDIGLGELVSAWGFGPDILNAERIKAQLGIPAEDAVDTLQLDPERGQVWKTAPLSLDLNGIAKGYGVDRMAQCLESFGVEHFLVSIDGEVRAKGFAVPGTSWAVAVEKPDPDRREPLGLIALDNQAVATSGDYRHWVDVGDQRLSHTMDPRIGGPSRSPLASVTVIASSCAEADAWATALMVMGPKAGPAFARERGISALLLTRNGADIGEIAVGQEFEEA